MRTPHNIVIEIDTSNAAFDECPQSEVSRILRGLCRDLAHGIDHDTRPLYDINGNSIGRVDIDAIKR
jgi:hypothetical protein